MTKKELIALCLSLPGVYEDYPFDSDGWAAIRHKGNKKTFAFIYERNGHLCANLKCEPMQADFWRSVYGGVTPAYHMNKTHWNTVHPDSDMPHGELLTMIHHSYGLTTPRNKPGGKVK